MGDSIFPSSLILFHICSWNRVIKWLIYSWLKTICKLCHIGNLYNSGNSVHLFGVFLKNTPVLGVRMSCCIWILCESRSLLLHGIATRGSTFSQGFFLKRRSNHGKFSLQNTRCSIVCTILIAAAASGHFHQGQHILLRLMNSEIPNILIYTL
jgi:hypothetical protein